MSTKRILRAAAFFTLFTFVGHSLGGILGPGPEQGQAHQVYSLMKEAQVQMPFGPAKDLATMMVGANILVSILLFLSGMVFIFISCLEKRAGWPERSILLINSIAMLATGIISLISFFPLPAVCTGLAGFLGLIAVRKI